METLSFELVEHIASFLNAGDALALSRVCRSVRQSCLSRLDPERYLQRTFRFPRYLLAAMADCGCILSGSRALEYFVPGSIQDDGLSDWDFLVPCVLDSIRGMMEALGQCGVAWQHPLDELFSLVDKPAGSVCFVASASVLSISVDNLLADPVWQPPTEALALYKQLRRFVLVEAQFTDWWVRIEVLATESSADCQPPPPRYRFTEVMGRTAEPDEETLQYYRSETEERPICLINGYIDTALSRSGGPRVKVQLFQCHESQGKAMTPLEYIVNTYYATHVQCFLSGWLAGHFYYDLASRRLALVWPLAPHQVHAVTSSAAKYRRRGYRFLYATDGTFVEFVEGEDGVLEQTPLQTAPAAPAVSPSSALDATISSLTQNMALMSMGLRTLGAHAPAPAAAAAAGPARGSGVDRPLTEAECGSLVLRASEPVRNGGLGRQGTQVIVFRPSFGNNANREVNKIMSSIAQFRTSTAKGSRPVGIEPIIPDMRRLRPRVAHAAAVHEGSAFEPARSMRRELALKAAVKDQGNQGAPPDVIATTSPADPGFQLQERLWAHYRILLGATSTVCQAGTCGSHVNNVLPPQI